MAADMETWAHDIVASRKWRESALSAIRKETAELLEEFRRQSSERRSEIFQMLGGFRKEMYAVTRERKKAAAAWHDIIGTLHAKTKKETRHGRGKKSEKSSSE
ncbi:MAG: hypothetical protein HZB83_06960 [Deltaproteobacteria bacterium]|nr:hypothetical protein [Deltaproteobacteria bacterium]